jgi:hypothetical protein
MPCEQRQKLMEQLAAIAEAHTNSLRTLNGMNRWEFDRGWDKAEALRLQKDLAQKALKEHEKQHGCRIDSLTALA